MVQEIAKGSRHDAGSLSRFARPEGLEPPTFWLGVCGALKKTSGDDLDALYEALCIVEHAAASIELP